jgi:polyribonucleotide nucleotidyltransferase
LNPIKKTFTLGTQQVTLETGEIARQAHGAVLCTVDDTGGARRGDGVEIGQARQSFFPLTVDYARRPTPRARSRRLLQARGRPTEKENPDLRASSTGRSGRCSRTAFTTKCRSVAQVLSLNPEVDADIRR